MSSESITSAEKESIHGRTVSLRSLFSGAPESRWVYMSGSQELPHPDAVYRECIVPVMLYAREFGVTVKGSTVRQAAELPLSKLQEDFRGPTFNLNRFLQYTAWPLMVDEINDLQPRQREQLMGLLATNDMDGVVGPSQADRFFSGLHTGLAPLLATLLTHGQSFRGDDARGTYGLIKKQARSQRKDPYPLKVVPDQDNHIRLQTPPKDSPYKFVAILPREVNMLPFARAKLSRQISQEYADLIVYTKEQTINRGDAQIRVATIGFGYDTRMTTLGPALNFDENHFMPIFSMDFSQRLDDKDENSNARTMTSYDRQEAGIKIQTPLLARLPYPKPGRSLMAIRFDPRYSMKDNDLLPQVSLRIAPSSMSVFQCPVELDNAWQQRPIPERMEGITRTLWEAVEAEMYDPQRISAISDTTCQQIAQELQTIGIEMWDTDIPHFKREFWQRSLLRAAITNPHRFVELAGKMGLWNILRRKNKEIPDANIVLGNIQQMLSQQEYRDLRDNTEKNFAKDQLGWYMIDKACNLAEVFPEQPNFIARVLQFLLI